MQETNKDKFSDTRKTHIGGLDFRTARAKRALSALDCWAAMQLAAGNPNTPTRDFILGVRREMVVAGFARDLTPASTSVFLSSARADALTVGKVLASKGRLYEQTCAIYHPREGNYSLYDGDDLSLERELLGRLARELGTRLGTDLVGTKRVNRATVRLLRSIYAQAVFDVSLAF